MADKVTENNEKATDQLYERLHSKIWMRRTAGFMAGATAFGLVGAIGGAIAAFIPTILTSLGVAGAATVGLPSVALVLSTAAIFAAATGLLGMVIGADVGSKAGSSTASLEERQRSEKGKGLAPENEPPAPSLFNWKTSLVSAGLFAAFGALMAFAPATSSIAAVLPLAAGSTASVVASASVLGMLGSTIGINFPYLSAKLSTFYKNLNTGQYQTPAQENAAAPQMQVEQARSNDVPTVNEPARESKSFAADTRKFSLNSILEKTDERASLEQTVQR